MKARSVVLGASNLGHQLNQVAQGDRTNMQRTEENVVFQIGNKMNQDKYMKDEVYLQNDGDIYDPYIVIVMTQLWR